MKPAFVVVCAWLFAEHARQPEIPGNLFAIILFGIVVSQRGLPSAPLDDLSDTTERTT